MKLRMKGICFWIAFLALLPTCEQFHGKLFDKQSRILVPGLEGRWKVVLVDKQTKVTEFETYFEIIASRDDRSAEKYRLDKKTGKAEMIWHEHPQLEFRMISHFSFIRQSSMEYKQLILGILVFTIFNSSDVIFFIAGTGVIASVLYFLRISNSDRIVLEYF